MSCDRVVVARSVEIVDRRSRQQAVPAPACVVLRWLGTLYLALEQLSVRTAVQCRCHGCLGSVGSVLCNVTYLADICQRTAWMSSSFTQTSACCEHA